LRREVKNVSFKKFSVCFVALIVLSVFAVSQVSSVSSASLSANVDYSTGVAVLSIMGSSWAPNTPVMIFWDTQDSAHQMAQCTPMGGSFSVTVAIPDTPLGLHHIIGVQGANTVTIPFTLCVVSPADDRILNSVIQANNGINTANNGINTANNGINTANTNIMSAINAINNGFVNVNNQITNVQNQLSSVQGKIDNSKATQILAYYEGNYAQDNAGGSGGPYLMAPGTNITADQPVLFTVAYSFWAWDPGQFSTTAGLFQVFTKNISPNAQHGVWEDECNPVNWYGGQTMGSVTFGSKFMVMYLGALNNADLRLYWTITVQGTPGTKVTQNS